jgi:hypothetical protein
VGSNSGRLLAIAAAVLAIFALTVPLREPWRGHLAPGQHWLTAMTLQFVKTSSRDGIWRSRFQLVETPADRKKKACPFSLFIRTLRPGDFEPR